jgi:hypothetical protein
MSTEYKIFQRGRADSPTALGLFQCRTGAILAHKRWAACARDVRLTGSGLPRGFPLVHEATRAGQDEPAEAPVTAV